MWGRPVQIPEFSQGLLDRMGMGTAGVDAAVLNDLGLPCRLHLAWPYRSRWQESWGPD
jgi:hypothetical protein